MKIQHLNWLTTHNIKFTLGEEKGFEVIIIDYKNRAETLEHFRRFKLIKDFEYIGTEKVKIIFQKKARF